MKTKSKFVFPLVFLLMLSLAGVAQALEESNLEQVNVMLEQGADPNYKSNSGWTPLFYVSNREQPDGFYMQDEQIVEALLAKGARALAGTLAFARVASMRAAVVNSVTTTLAAS